MLIALEGIDGAGTTTQLERLRAHYGEQRFHFTREPSHNEIGKLIRVLLRGEHQTDPTAMALLFAADRMQHLSQLERRFAAGKHVITDRYKLSSLAYQGLLVDFEFVARINERAREPDLTILLEVPVEVAEQRRLARGQVGEIYEYREMQVRVAGAYARLARREGALILDGARDPDAVFAEVLAAVETCIARSRAPSSS